MPFAPPQNGFEWVQNGFDWLKNGFKWLCFFTPNHRLTRIKTVDFRNFQMGSFCKFSFFTFPTPVSWVLSVECAL
jgi:hypothetical protein